jgi:hypothetical protein
MLRTRDNGLQIRTGMQEMNKLTPLPLSQHFRKTVKHLGNAMKEIAKEMCFHSPVNEVK